MYRFNNLGQINRPKSGCFRMAVGCFTHVLAIIGLLTLIMLFLSCSPDPLIDSEDINYSSIDNYNDLNIIEQDIFELINYERTSRGILSITSDKFSYEVEEIHVIDLALWKVINHDGFFARKDLLTSRGVWLVGEIVAMKYTNANSVVNAWMDSEGHRKAILNPLYDAAGFVVIEHTNGDLYFGVLFIDYKLN